MHLTVSAEHLKERLDKFVAQKTELTRSQIQGLIEKEFITVNGTAVKPGYKLRADDEIRITMPEAEPETLVPEDIPLDVLYSDDDIVVINKPPGLVVHPAAGNRILP